MNIGLRYICSIPDMERIMDAVQRPNLTLQPLEPCYISLLRAMIERRDFVATWYENLPVPYTGEFAEGTVRHRDYFNILQRLLYTLEEVSGEHNRREERWQAWEKELLGNSQVIGQEQLRRPVEQNSNKAEVEPDKGDPRCSIDRGIVGTGWESALCALLLCLLS